MVRDSAAAPATERIWHDLEVGMAGSAPPLHVLFATDGSAEAGAAEQFLHALPLRVGSSIEVLTVLDAPEWDVPASLAGAELEWACRVVRGVEGRLLRDGVRVAHAIPRGAPAESILQAADEFHADLIVVGSRGRTGLKRLLLGSVAEKVARHARQSVLVARAPRHELRRIIVAVDGSAQSDRAARLAARLPLPEGCRVIVCHVVRPYTPSVGPDYLLELEATVAEIREQQRKQASRIVEAAMSPIEAAGKGVEVHVAEGDPATEILDLARREEADLIVAGARGMNGFEALLLGSVADRLVRNDHCSLLLAR